MSVEWTTTLAVGFTSLIAWAMVLDVRYRTRDCAVWWIAAAMTACLVAISTAAIASAGAAARGIDIRIPALAASGIAAASGISHFVRPAEVKGDDTPTRSRRGGAATLTRARGHRRNRAHSTERMKRSGCYRERMEQVGRPSDGSTLIDAMVDVTDERLQGSVAADATEAGLTLVDELVDVAPIERSKR